MFHFLKLGRLDTVWGLAPLLPRQEFCHRHLDPQQLVARSCVIAHGRTAWIVRILQLVRN